MEEIIDAKTFITQLLYCIKLSIFANRGTTDEVTLERCIKIYNSYGTVLSATTDPEQTKKNTDRVRIAYKRINLVMKQQNGQPVNVKDRTVQTLIHQLPAYVAVISNDLPAFLTSIPDDHQFLPDVKTVFMLEPGKEQKLIW